MLKSIVTIILFHKNGLFTLIAPRYNNGAILLKNKRGSYKSRAHHAFFSGQFWN